MKMCGLQVEAANEGDIKHGGLKLNSILLAASL